MASEDHTLLLEANFLWFLFETFFFQSICPLLYEHLLFNLALNVNVLKGFFFISTPDSAFPIIFMPSLIISKH